MQPEAYEQPTLFDIPQGACPCPIAKAVEVGEQTLDHNPDLMTSVEQASRRAMLGCLKAILGEVRPDCKGTSEEGNCPENDTVNNTMNALGAQQLAHERQAQAARQGSMSGEPSQTGQYL